MMNAFRFNRLALTAITLGALLAGCGGTQNAMNAQTALVPQSPTRVSHGKSWMLPEAENAGDLLYVANDGRADDEAYVLVYTFPTAKHVGTITGLVKAAGECSDASGNVFIVSPGQEFSDPTTIYEYAHGGATPLQSLTETGDGIGCAVDPATGNLAVANSLDDNNPYGYQWGSIAIFPQATGNATMVYSTTAQGFWYCGYDDKSNLYISAGWRGAVMLDSLDAGSNNIKSVHLKKAPIFEGGSFMWPSVQWDGSEMTVSSPVKYESPHQWTGPVNVYRLHISGRKATVTGTTRLNSPQDRQTYETWIQGSSIVGLTQYKGKHQASFWAFPAGGSPTKQITLNVKSIASNIFSGITISVAPSRTRIR